MIGLITTSYPQFPGDPSGHFVAAHASALHRDVDILCAGANANVNANADVDANVTGSSPLANESRRPRPASGITVTRIPAHPSLFFSGGAPEALERGSPRTLLAAASFSVRLAAAVARRAHRWDAIIAHWLAPSALAALASAPHTPLLAIAHGGDIHTLHRLRLLAPTLHLLRLRRARLAFVSADLLALGRASAPGSAALQRYLDTALVQPMGLDLAHFAALPRVPTTPPTILVAARLTPIKGVDIALAALSHLHTPVHLVIAGAGPEHAALAAAAPARVTFLGAVSTTERDALLARASVVVIPSRPLLHGRTEGTPLIALEALAAGIPVVASATGGLRALAPAVALVPAEDPARLAAAIDHALRAPKSPESLRASVAHLDWSHVATVLAPTHSSA